MLCDAWHYCQINSTENRSVLHVALRAARDATICSDGKNVVPDVWNVLDKIKEFTETVRSGSWVRKGSKFMVIPPVLCQPSVLTCDLSGWSNGKGTKRCCGYWYWWQLFRPFICAHCTTNW